MPEFYYCRVCGFRVHADYSLACCPSCGCNEWISSVRFVFGKKSVTLSLDEVLEIAFCKDSRGLRVRKITQVDDPVY